ncbi:unnamed protein product, partial [marine sediment metagenome]
KEKKPILKDLITLIEHLIEIGFKKENIHSICDPGLKFYIDRPVEFEVLIREGVVLPSPKVADEFILSFALKHDFCFIISNDKYRDYHDQLPSKQWLQDRRVSFMFIGDKIGLSPNIEYARIELLPVEDRKDGNKNLTKKERTTLDVLEKIKETSGEFDLF